MDVSSMNEQLQEFIQKEINVSCNTYIQREMNEKIVTGLHNLNTTFEEMFETLTRNTDNGFEMLSKSFEQKIKTLIQEEIKHHVRGTEKDSHPAFLAIWTEDTVTLRRNDIIKFNHVVTNVGNGYSPMTGKFKAPKQGTYFFGGTVVSAPLMHFI
ncbi:C1QL [Mytilus coruscus]|uniref:C1QL n=1 Tax=Mytilus coruscus TaxID=42192 RepID=A0A6J8DRV3_MYTCO|nr:C1QL [Mytilus coruscus]